MCCLKRRAVSASVPARFHIPVCNGGSLLIVLVEPCTRCFVEWWKSHGIGLHKPGNSASDQFAFAGSDCDDECRYNSVLGYYYALGLEFSERANRL